MKLTNNLVKLVKEFILENFSFPPNVHYPLETAANRWIGPANDKYTIISKLT